MKEIRNDSRLAKVLVYCGIAACVAGALFYLYKAYMMIA